MVTIELNEHSAYDVKRIRELQSLGVPDDFIQNVYDLVCQLRKDGYGSDSDG